MSKDVFVLGIDPGFANVGYALVKLIGGKEEILALGVFRTQKSSTKKQILSASDDFRRTREITAMLNKIHPKIGFSDLTALCMESMSFPRSASVAAKMAMCVGVLAALAEIYEIPAMAVSPQDLKKSVCNKKTASKEEIQFALIDRYSSEIVSPFIEKVPSSFREHAFDALGSIVSCLNSEVLQFARKVSS